MRTNGSAKISVININPLQRAMGRLVNIDLGDEIKSLEIDSQGLKDLGADAFWRYYQPEPKFQDDEKIPLERQLNKRLLNWASRANGWEASRAGTVGSILVSSVTSGLLAQKLATDPEIKKALDEQEKAAQEQQKADKLEQESEKQEQQGQGEQAKQTQEQAEQSREKAQAHADAANAQMDKLENSQFGSSVRGKIVKDAKDAGEEAYEIVSGWGIDPADPSIENTNEVLDAMKYFQNILPDLTKLIGRAKGIALNSRHHTEKKGNVIVQDGYTRNLINAFPSELALLRPDANPLLRATKTAEFADRGILGMIEGTDSIEEGGLVIAVDESGSMSGSGYLLQAKALALGIAQAAKESGQPFRLFSFATDLTDNDPDAVVEVSDTDEWITVLKWASHNFNGGTNFDRPLLKALENVHSFGDKAQNADIVFISDGECRINPDVFSQVLATKDLLGTRIVYLAFGETEYECSIQALSNANIQIGNRSDFSAVAEELSEALRHEPEIQ